MQVVTGRLQHQCGKNIVLTFRFLNAEHVGPVRFEPGNDGVQTNADRVDVIRGDFHEYRKYFSAVNPDREEIWLKIRVVVWPQWPSWSLSWLRSSLSTSFSAA